ncbi:NADPH-dependent FMN reductase [Alloalcanivorax mobilis]|uniref:NADPH-dependent FMN reductase n=1 Tax=Alloalcanivorax mobilis TaxID=2019569 RepID=UPI000B5B385A|nr:NAD(P)H-dependent oxidoreductase [Alloalcanivorax mobilis]ASK32980.1 NADPH-dependent FMN reductase [Alcanivorax sp. N3-2A]ASK36798.1 NADPH-dependent FMN reductase [Alcanivorax sp. N3-2A]|tara:strand:+ start:774 stop:1334 length:561 start_codon:yes stop_codon:yes gene_type:complete
MLKLNVIIASTRPGRVGKAVADWFDQAARQHGAFEVNLVDLAEMALPIFDEPHHPRQQNYQHDHTKRWAASVDSADAYVLVVPEYNFGPTPALVNALNYVYNEWNYKPVAFVSYGGMSGGIRSVQTTKLTLTTLKMMPLIEQVAVPMVNQHLDNGVFKPEPVHEEAATAMLNELNRWASALKPMRG